MKKNRFKMFWTFNTAIIASTPIFVSAFLIYNLVNNQINEYSHRFGKTIAESLKSFLVEDFFYLEYGNITHKLMTLKQNANLDRIMAFDMNGRPIFDTQDSEVFARKHQEIVAFNTTIRGVDGTSIGKVTFSIPIDEQLYHQKRVLFITLFLAILCALLVFYLIQFAINRLLTPYEKIYKNMSELAQGNFVTFEDYLKVKDERAILNKHYNEIVHTLKRTQEELTEASKREALSKMASQVSHDIRSPLAVLNTMVSKKLNTIGEDTRVIIRNQINRIQDIANNLLDQNKEGLFTEKTCIQQELFPELLSSAIESIITEKRLYFRTQLQVTIEGDVYGNDSYGLFALIHLGEFKRVLSNLINNAVEALYNQKGKVVVTLSLLSEGRGFAQVKVSDNGRGIPPELIGKLGTLGASYGKEKQAGAGSGLGLFHARTTVEGWGGTFRIESIVGQGTTILITLPKSYVPQWFATQIKLQEKQAVVILDDDQGIHFTWENRFKELNISNGQIEIFHLSTPLDFDSWIHTKGHLYQNALFLNDYELIGFQETGLDLIEKHSLQNAVLVTSHYENQAIRKRCSHINIKLIPKMLAGFVPIEYEKPIDENLKDCWFDSIYIEDDPDLREAWELCAKEKGVKLLTLASTKEWPHFEEKISKEHTNIYLDSNLGAGEMRGEEFAQILRDRGYKNLYMASGFKASSFAHLPWIKYVTKEHPFLTSGKF